MFSAEAFKGGIADKTANRHTTIVSSFFFVFFIICLYLSFSIQIKIHILPYKFNIDFNFTYRTKVLIFTKTQVIQAASSIFPSCSMALATWVRREILYFLKILVRWPFTVRSLMDNAAAISLLVLPSTSSAATSRSRFVNPTEVLSRSSSRSGASFSEKPAPIFRIWIAPSRSTRLATS